MTIVKGMQIDAIDSRSTRKTTKLPVSRVHL